MGRPKGSKNKTPKVPKVSKVKKQRKKRVYWKKKDEHMASRKNVETLQSLDFGFTNSQCYRASMISIGGEPFFGFIKCWRPPGHYDYNYTKTRCFMPIKAWISFTRDILPEIKTPQSVRIVELEDAQRYYMILFLVTCHQSHWQFHQSQSLIVYK